MKKSAFLFFLFLSFNAFSSDERPFEPYFSIEFGGGHIQLKDFKKSTVTMDFGEDVLVAKLRYQLSAQVSLAFSTANHVSCYSCGGFVTDDNYGWREIDYRSSFYQLEGQYHYSLEKNTDLTVLAGVNYSDEEFEVQECQSRGFNFGGKFVRFCSGSSKVDELSDKETTYAAIIGIGATHYFNKSWSVQTNYKYSHHREGLSIFELTIGYSFH